MSTVRIPNSHGDIWQHRDCLYDLPIDEALLVTFLLLSQVPSENQGGGEDEFPLYVATFNRNQAYQFVGRQMECTIRQHELTLQNHDAAYPYCYSRKEFNKALTSLCGRMGWELKDDLTLIEITDTDNSKGSQ